MTDGYRWDIDFFNAADHRAIEQVAGLYTDPASVRQELERGCRIGLIRNWTLVQVYDHLVQRGFTRKGDSVAYLTSLVEGAPAP